MISLLAELYPEMAEVPVIESIMKIVQLVNNMCLFLQGLQFLKWFMKEEEHSTFPMQDI